MKPELKNLKKIRSEFLTEAEARYATEKIRSYCMNVNINANGGDFFPAAEYESYGDYIGYENYMFDGAFSPSAGTGPFGIGGLGMTTNWHLSPNSLTDKYRQTFPHFHIGHDQSSRTTLEADVSDDNYEYVREKLYSNGAITVS